MCWKNNFFDGFALNIVIEWMCYAIQNKKIFGLFFNCYGGLQYTTITIINNICLMKAQTKLQFFFFYSTT